MEELKVDVKQETGKISINFEEVKNYLSTRLEEYRTLVFTDDNIKDAKKVVASLRAEQKDLKSRVSDVKKEYMRPFDVFKTQTDELYTLYDTPINFINEQISAFEEKRIAEKKELIEKLYAENIGDMKEYLPLAKMYDQRWENVTCKEKEIVSEMQESIISVRNAVNLICGMNSESCDKALEMYKKDLSLNNAIAYINQYEAQKAEFVAREHERRVKEEEERVRQEERNRISEEERIRQEERDRIAQEERSNIVEPEKEETAEEIAPEELLDMSEERNDFLYSVSLSESEKEMLETFFSMHNIKYTEV